LTYSYIFCILYRGAIFLKYKIIRHFDSIVYDQIKEFTLNKDRDNRDENPDYKYEHDIMVKPKKEKETKRLSAIFDDIKIYVSEGAKALSEMSAELFEEVKEKAEELYEAGYEKFEQASGVVQDYIDKYQSNKEIKALTEEKMTLYISLGDKLFHEFKKNDRISKRFLSTNKMSTLFSKIESVDKKILQIGKELDKNKKA